MIVRGVALVATLSIGIAFQTAVAARDGHLRTADIDLIEQTVALPEGAHAVAGYARYYTAETVSRRPMIKGVFLWHGSEPAGRYLRRSSSDVADGGCDVVTVFFDLKTRRIAGAFCNGLG